MQSSYQSACHKHVIRIKWLRRLRDAFIIARTPHVGVVVEEVASCRVWRWRAPTMALERLVAGEDRISRTATTYSRYRIRPRSCMPVECSSTSRMRECGLRPAVHTIRARARANRPAVPLTWSSTSTYPLSIQRRRKKKVDNIVLLSKLVHQPLNVGCSPCILLAGYG